MADSVTGIPVFALADLKTAGAGANVIGGTNDNDTVPEAVVVRDRWNQRAVVAVKDHPADGGDAAERAVFVQDSHNNVWRLAGAKLGSFDGNEDGPHIVIPE